MLLDCLTLRTEPRASGILRKCLTSELSLQSLQQTFTMQLSASKFSLIFPPIVLYKTLSTRSSTRKCLDNDIFTQMQGFVCLRACPAGWLLLSAVLGIRPKVMCTPGRHSTTDLHHQTTFLSSSHLFLFYEYFPCIYVCVPCVSLRKSEECLELEMAVNHPIGTRNLTWVFCNRNKCS